MNTDYQQVELENQMMDVYEDVDPADYQDLENHFCTNCASDFTGEVYTSEFYGYGDFCSEGCTFNWELDFLIRYGNGN